MARMNCSTSPWCFSVNRENHIRQVCGVTAAGAASRTAASNFFSQEELIFKHILIPTDGSPVANKAAKAGIALAIKLGAKVTAYFALEELQPIYVEGYSLC